MTDIDSRNKLKGAPMADTKLICWNVDKLRMMESNQGLPNINGIAKIYDNF